MLIEASLKGAFHSLSPPVCAHFDYFAPILFPRELSTCPLLRIRFKTLFISQEFPMFQIWLCSRLLKSDQSVSNLFFFNRGHLAPAFPRPSRGFTTWIPNENCNAMGSFESLIVSLARSGVNAQQLNRCMRASSIHTNAVKWERGKVLPFTYMRPMASWRSNAARMTDPKRPFRFTPWLNFRYASSKRSSQIIFLYLQTLHKLYKSRKMTFFASYFKVQYSIYMCTWQKKYNQFS